MLPGAGDNMRALAAQAAVEDSRADAAGGAIAIRFLLSDDPASSSTGRCSFGCHPGEKLSCNGWERGHIEVRYRVEGDFTEDEMKGIIAAAVDMTSERVSTRLNAELDENMDRLLKEWTHRKQEYETTIASSRLDIVTLEGKTTSLQASLIPLGSSPGALQRPRGNL